MSDYEYRNKTFDYAPPSRAGSAGGLLFVGGTLWSRADSKTNHHSPNAGGCHPAPARFLCARPACAHPIFADKTPC
jgi:hypothetical protein